MKIKFEDIKMNFGKYKGYMMKDIPENYLSWCIKNNILKGKKLFYAQNKLDLPKNKYKITVEDSVKTDGVYTVEAYNSKHAINECKRLFGIQTTQSYHGTKFRVEKLQ